LQVELTIHLRTFIERNTRISTISTTMVENTNNLLSITSLKFTQMSVQIIELNSCQIKFKIKLG